MTLPSRLAFYYLFLILILLFFHLSGSRLGLTMSTLAFRFAPAPSSHLLLLLPPSTSGRLLLIAPPRTPSALPRRPASRRLRGPLLPPLPPRLPSMQLTGWLLVGEDRNQSIRLPR